MKSAQKVKATTQKFIEIEDISEDVVILKGGNACLVIKIEAVNFSLLSKKEQDSKIYSYISLLNSLSFPVEILIRNERIDLSSYAKFLEQEAEKMIRINTGLANYVKQYKDFVQNIITVNTVLDKNFYIVIPYSYLEAGIKGAKNKTFKKDVFFLQAKTSLHTKANSILSQLSRLSLRAKILGKEELIKIFYRIYNDSDSVQTTSDIKTAIVRST